MDIKTLLNNLHEELSCSVCKNTFTNPKQLPCLHSFCLDCLNGILRTSGRHDVIKCPECRRESRVPRSRNLNDLPTNFRINSLLDVLAIKECDTIGVKCGNCDKKSTQSFYCFQCCEFWCEAECVILHNGIKANRKHRALALKDFQDEDFENVVKRPAFCQEEHHETEELKFFCQICEIAICNACALSNHDGHTKILLEEAANKSKMQVKSFIEMQKKDAQQKRNKIAQLGESCKQIQEQAATVTSNAQTFKEMMLTLIEAQKQEMFNKLENQERESIKRLRSQKSEIEHQIKMSETAAEQTETLFKQGTSAEIVQLDTKSFHAFFQEGAACKEEESVNQSLETSRPHIFVGNTKLMGKICNEGIGFFKTFFTAEGKGISEATVGLEAQFVVSTRNSNGEQCYDERNCVTVEIRNKQEQDCTTKVQVEDNKDGSYKVTYFAKETGKCDLSVKVNEHNLIGSPFVVQVKPRQYRPTLSFGQQGSHSGMLSFPWGVAVNERNEIAVTDTGNKRLQIFSGDGTYLRSFGTEGNKQGSFNFPCGIAFDERGNIVVADSNNHRVQVFSEQGEFLSQFGEQGSLDHQFEGPHGLSCDRGGNVIVADRNNKLIKVFSNNSQFTRKIALEGSFTDPFHCVEYQEYFIVSESDEHCIKVFDLAGRFLHKFGKKGDGDGEFNVIRCLSVNKAGHLMVCDLWNHRVQVFELSGKFVAKFGTKGSGMGELNKPTSTAVLSDGRIVVTDYGNHRIQIFE